MCPYPDKYDNADDQVLVRRAASGSLEAANELVKRHQKFIYNVVLKFVNNTEDAADLTQDILIKMLTKLFQFEYKSSFRTWLYSLAMNHYLNSKRGKGENRIQSWEQISGVRDRLYSEGAIDSLEKERYKDRITELRNKYMKAVLLCLDRQQRMVLILGSIFGLKSYIAAELLHITPDNFRQQLVRAKKDLSSFMENKCGLIDPRNPCRCRKKAKGFMNDGLLDSSTNLFTREAVQNVGAVVDSKNAALDELMEGRYRRFFSGRHYETITPEENLIYYLLRDPDVKELFKLAD